MDSSEALNLLYPAMRPALHRRIAMAIKFASDSPFFCCSQFVLAHKSS